MWICFWTEEENSLLPYQNLTPTHILLLDGHSSHMFNQEFLELMRNHNVHVVCFPAHIAHILQPADRDVLAAFDPIAPSTSIQTDDTMPPDSSNIVKVKTTSFDDLITLPTCNCPSIRKPKRSKPPWCYLTCETNFDYVRSRAKGKGKGKTEANLCRKVQGQIRSEERRGVDVRRSLQSGSTRHEGRKMEWLMMMNHTFKDCL